MANTYSFGFAEFDHILEKLEYIPNNTKNDMMKAAAKVYERTTAETSDRMVAPGVGKNTKTGKPLGEYVTHYTKNRIVTKKRGRDTYVTWESDIRHKKDVHANEVAFLTEYGVPSRGIPARPFIAQSVREGFDEAYEAALEVLTKSL